MYRERATRVKFENHYDALEVQEVLREPYSVNPFQMENLPPLFAELET